MPVLDVEVVVGPGEALEPGLAQELADVAGEALGRGPGHTWVKLRALGREQYAEDRAPLPEAVRPVFVSVLKARLCGAAELEDEAARLCEAIARVCGRPRENVHVLYLPEAAGRMAFGGRLLT